MGPGVEKISLVFDREGFIRKCFDPPFLKEMANTFEKVYPERVEKIFVRDVNWLFWIMFKIVKPFLPSATATKIVLLGSDTRKDLLNHIDEDELWVRYGGTWKMPDQHVRERSHTFPRATVLKFLSNAEEDIWYIYGR
jgi:hypothetical protein